LKTKIIIGTANFLTKYGLYKNYVNQKELTSIRGYLKEKNIIFDTSFNYKNLEKIFKLFNKLNCNYIIKISLNKKNENQLEEIFKNIKEKHKIKKKFYAILLHNSNILKTKSGTEAFKKLYKLKKKGLVKKVGISTYGYENIIKLQRKKIKFDIIQTNGNILDNRFFNFLKKNKKLRSKEIHIRSIFLQGMLLKKKIPKKFRKFSKTFKELNRLSKDLDTNIFQLLIHHVYKQKVNGLVFGIKNKKELEKIFHLMTNMPRFKNPGYNFERIQNSLIDPRKW
jgi:aryl-alcohol dehydrogenase-like predicted oxidoreductase